MVIEDSQQSINNIVDAIKKLLLEKNKRYGDSAIKPKRRFSKLGSSEGILIRLDDKMNRIENSDNIRVNDITDMIGYLILLLISMGVNADDINSLID